MSKKIRRPPNVPYPNEWLVFKSLNDGGDAMVQYRIHDLPPSRFEDAVKHMTRYFLTDEPLCQSRNLKDHPRSIYEFQDIIRTLMIENKMTIACFREGSEEIVGLNILYVKRRDDPVDWQDFQCPDIRDIKTMTEFISGQFDVFDHYNVDKYLSGLGISVSPLYRNRGIAQKLLEAQTYIGKSFGIILYSNVFTSEILQKCANQLKYDNNYETSYAKLASKGGVFSYPNILSSNIQIRSYIIKPF